MKSRVYFIGVPARGLKERQGALEKLLEKASPFAPLKKGEIVPVKVTVGDASCVYQTHPGLVKSVISRIKACGAKPFLFDTNVIYQGQRQNAVDHLVLAEAKGFSYASTGAPFIIADGLLGQDGREFEINSAFIKKKVRLPSFIGMLESLVVLSHATGHILAGYAGAIKNVAMGMACRSTKQIEHSSLKPKVAGRNCTACGCCIDVCPAEAISFRGGRAFINQEICLGCGECLCACKFDAIEVNWQEDVGVFAKRMSEVANVILSGFKNKFFINFAFDITKDCDCMSAAGENMISKDIGILASHDIVSLDKATADLSYSNRTAGLLEEARPVYEGMFRHAAELGMGNLEYELVNV